MDWEGAGQAEEDGVPVALTTGTSDGATLAEDEGGWDGSSNAGRAEDEGDSTLPLAGGDDGAVEVEGDVNAAAPPNMSMAGAGDADTGMPGDGVADSDPCDTPPVSSAGATGWKLGGPGGPLVAALPDPVVPEPASLAVSALAAPEVAAAEMAAVALRDAVDDHDIEAVPDGVVVPDGVAEEEAGVVDAEGVMEGVREADGGGRGTEHAARRSSACARNVITRGVTPEARLGGRSASCRRMAVTQSAMASVSVVGTASLARHIGLQSAVAEVTVAHAAAAGVSKFASASCVASKHTPPPPSSCCPAPVSAASTCSMDLLCPRPPRSASVASAPPTVIATTSTTATVAIAIDGFRVAYGWRRRRCCDSGDCDGEDGSGGCGGSAPQSVAAPLLAPILLGATS